MVTTSGGNKANEALTRIRMKLESGKGVNVGFFPEAQYPNGTFVATVAAIQEFGSGKIPARSFIRTTVAAKQKEWGPALAAILEANGYDSAKALSAVGQGIQGQIRQGIIDVVAPPLSPLTLMIRKMKIGNSQLVVTGATLAEARRRLDAGESVAGVSTKPLINTSFMMDQVQFKVET